MVLSGGLAPNGLKSLNTFLGGLVAVRIGLSTVNGWTGEDGVGGAPCDAEVRRGGNRPPGTYLNPTARLFCLNLSVNRLPGT